MTLALDDKQHPTPRTVLLGRQLRNRLAAAHKRLRMTGDPAREARDIRDAEIALQTHEETLARLIADAKNAVKRGWIAQ